MCIRFAICCTIRMSYNRSSPAITFFSPVPGPITFFLSFRLPLLPPRIAQTNALMSGENCCVHGNIENCSVSVGKHETSLSVCIFWSRAYLPRKMKERALNWSLLQGRQRGIQMCAQCSLSIGQCRHRSSVNEHLWNRVRLVRLNMDLCGARKKFFVLAIKEEKLQKAPQVYHFFLQW